MTLSFQIKSCLSSPAVLLHVIALMYTTSNVPDNSEQLAHSSLTAQDVEGIQSWLGE